MNLCARCLLLIVGLEAEEPLVDTVDEAPPCELLSVIGETETAITFLGEQTWPLKRLVALKVFKADVFSPAAFRRALRQEPVHPAIAPVLESGYMGGRPYVMSAFLGGGSLAQRYTRPGMGVHARLQALLVVTDALVFAHEHGVAHGRLVPSNVLCEPQPPFTIQIVDFACNGRKGAGPESFESLARDDVAAVVAFADLVLDDAVRMALPEPALERLRRATASALELRRALEHLQARVAPQ